MDMSTVVLIVAVTIAAVLTTAFYRICLHPLAKFPGPFWARLTTFPSHWHTLRGGSRVDSHARDSRL